MWVSSLWTGGGLSPLSDIPGWSLARVEFLFTPTHNPHNTWEKHIHTRGAGSHPIRGNHWFLLLCIQDSIDDVLPQLVDICCNMQIKRHSVIVKELLVKTITVIYLQEDSWLTWKNVILTCDFTLESWVLVLASVPFTISHLALITWCYDCFSLKTIFNPLASVETVGPSWGTFVRLII